MKNINNAATIAASKAVAAYLQDCTDIVFSADAAVGFECVTPTAFSPKLVCIIAFAGPVALAEWAGESQWTFATASDEAAVRSEFVDDPKTYSASDVVSIQTAAHKIAAEYAVAFRPTIEALADELALGQTLTSRHVRACLARHNPHGLRLEQSRQRSMEEN